MNYQAIMNKIPQDKTIMIFTICNAEYYKLIVLNRNLIKVCDSIFLNLLPFLSNLLYLQYLSFQKTN